jgi:hypothetical protein
MKGKKYSAHATGGKVQKGDMARDEAPSDVYAGANSNVLKEAAKKKRGGAMKHVGMHGESAKHRLDRPARKSGGRVGSEMSPFSAASKVKTPAGRDVDAGES